MSVRPANPYTYFLVNEWKFIGWCLYHLFVLLCFCVGLYYAYRYMLLPDRVLIRDRQGLIAFGSTGPVVNAVTADHIARSVAEACLNVSYKYTDNRARKALLGQSAYKRLEEYQEDWIKEIIAQQMTQHIVIDKVELAGQPDQECLAFVSGSLYRDGIYEHIPYHQILSFRLGMRLVRGRNDKEFPLRVLRMNYEEHALYDFHKM